MACVIEKKTIDSGHIYIYIYVNINQKIKFYSILMLQMMSHLISKESLTKSKLINCILHNIEHSKI